MSKSDEETYATEFARWRAEDRGKYEAPGYAEDPKAALAFLRANRATMDIVTSGDFWPDERYLDLKGSTNSPTVEPDDCALVMHGENAGGSLYFIRVCDFFTALGSGEDPLTGDSILVLRFIGARAQPRTIVIPRDVVAQGDRTLAAHCQARGFNVTPDKRGRIWFQHLLTHLHGPPLLTPGKSGWVGKTMSFALPSGEIVGDSGKARIHFDPARTREARVGRVGSFEEWNRTVSTLVPGNSRLELALCAAFASPLMEFFKRVQPTMINIYGETTRGKSISGFLFGSVWGGSPDDRLGFAHSWNQTENSTMALAAAHSGIGLALDELKLCAKPGRIGYVFSEGEERGRLNSESEQRHRRKWRLLCMSSGERRLGELIAEAGAGEPCRQVRKRVASISRSIAQRAFKALSKI